MYFIDFLFSCLVQLGIEKLNQMCLFLKFIISKIYKNSKLIKKRFSDHFPAHSLGGMNTIGSVIPILISKNL